MLRLVPPPRGEGQDPPRRRHGNKGASLFLTADEARHLRVAMKNTARALGGMDVLAEVTGMTPGSVRVAAYNTRRRPSAAVALAVARAAGMSIEAVLSGTLSAAGRCKACGSRVGDRPMLAAGGAS